MLNFFYKPKVRDHKVSARSNDNKFLGIFIFCVFAFVMFVVNKTTDMDLISNIIFGSLFFIVGFPLCFGLSSYYVVHDDYIFSREGFKFKKIRIQDLYYCCRNRKHFSFISRTDKEITFNFSIFEEHVEEIFLTRLHRNRINYSIINPSGKGKAIFLPYYDFIMKKTFSFSEAFNNCFSFMFIIFFVGCLKEQLELGNITIGLITSFLLVIYGVFKFINKAFRKIHVSNEGILVHNLTKKAFVSFNDITKAETIMVSYGGGKGSLSYQVEHLVLYHEDDPISMPLPISRDFTHFDILLGVLHNHGIPVNQEQTQAA